MNPIIHETAILEQDVRVGTGTRVWSHVHIRRGAEIGEDCIIGEKTYIAYEVKIGSRCKINAFVHLCNGVTLEDGVMVGAHTAFTNDRFPRAASWDTDELLPSGPSEETANSIVRRGAALGAGVLVGPGISIGEWAMVGMGSVVTRDVAPYTLVAGNPARVAGYVCRCGWRVAAFVHGPEGDLKERIPCGHCGAALTIDAGGGIVWQPKND